MVPPAISRVGLESASTGAWVWKVLTWNRLSSPKTTHPEFLGCFLFSYKVLVRGIFFHYVFVSPLMQRQRRNGSHGHDRTAKGAVTHSPVRLWAGSCAASVSGKSWLHLEGEEGFSISISV